MTDIPLYSTAELVETIRTIRTPRRFFRDRFFRSTPHLSTREEIVFDEVLEDLPVMAPFVAPIVEAKPQRRHGFQSKTFRPAYVKPKHFVKPGDFLTREAGENLLGAQTPQQRMNNAVVNLLAMQRRQIEEREEWLAARAVIDGRVTIAGEDYPAVEVDFGRDADNTITITAPGSVWSNRDADIGGQFEDWSDQLLEKTGYAGTDVIMSTEAWKNFRQNNNVRKEADLRRGIQNVPNLQAQTSMEGVRDAGMYGEFHLWVYNGRFKEQDGSLSRALEAHDVVMTAAPSEEDGTGGIHGIPCYGAIQDTRAGLQPLQIFPKNWEVEDPSGRILMSQSAPIMVPGRSNAAIKVRTSQQ